MSKLNNKILRFANCIPVNGFTSSLIYDLQKCVIYKIPNYIYEILTKFNGKKLQIIKSAFSDHLHDEIDSYLKMMHEKEILFFTSNPKLFAPMSMDWDEPFVITNAIIDLQNDISFAIKFTEELSSIGCKALQIRAFCDIKLDELEPILNCLIHGKVNSVEILIKYSNKYKMASLKRYFRNHPQVAMITFYNSPWDKAQAITNTLFGKVFFTTNEIGSEKCCGKIEYSFFTINIKTFTESLKHNSCLNRKISIDSEGNIKNCPSMTESFGNIKTTTLMEAIEKPGFKKYWDINKDKIHVCKDCEFRYVCTDCRAYVEHPRDLFSKPLKCGYNPYTGEWSEWSTNPLKQKAIEFYGMKEMVQERQKRLEEEVRVEEPPTL